MGKLAFLCSFSLVVGTSFFLVESGNIWLVAAFFMSSYLWMNSIKQNSEERRMLEYDRMKRTNCQSESFVPSAMGECDWISWETATLRSLSDDEDIVYPDADAKHRQQFVMASERVLKVIMGAYGFNRETALDFPCAELSGPAEREYKKFLAWLQCRRQIKLPLQRISCE